MGSPAKNRERRMRTLLIGALLLAVGSPTGARAQSPKDAVQAVVKNVFDGMRKRDTALMRAQFAPGARLVGVEAKAGTSEVRSIDPSLWIGGVGKGTGPAWDERIFE